MTERHPREPDEDSTPPGDPSGIEEPHDTLAAEEFAIGTRYERFPADPSGIQEPHDTLAAEEFAMPLPERPRSSVVKPAGGGRPWLPLVLLAALIAFVLVRRR
jgi:hypothetical protein